MKKRNILLGAVALMCLFGTIKTEKVQAIDPPGYTKIEQKKWIKCTSGVKVLRCVGGVGSCTASSQELC